MVELETNLLVELWEVAANSISQKELPNFAYSFVNLLNGWDVTLDELSELRGTNSVLDAALAELAKEYELDDDDVDDVDVDFN